MSVDDESDKHVEARDRRYSCLIKDLPKLIYTSFWVFAIIVLSEDRLTEHRQPLEDLEDKVKRNYSEEFW